MFNDVDSESPGFGATVNVGGKRMTDFEKEGTIGWITRLFGHLAWADRTLLERLEQVPNAEALRLLAHVVVAERIWLGWLRND
jgi:hypothetical protein